MVSRTWRTEWRRLSEPDLSAWVANSRLSLLGALPDHAGEPSVQAAVTRYLTHIGGAIERLKSWTDRVHQGVKRAARSARDADAETAGTSLTMRSLNFREVLRGLRRVLGRPSRVV